MRVTTSIVSKCIWIGLLFTSCARGQNATNSTLEPSPQTSGPTLEPSVQNNTTEPPELNVTEPSPIPNVTEGPQINPTRSPMAPPEKLECYDNSTLLREHLALKNTFTPETYILCSNTVFEVGVASDPGTLCCIDGQSPLHVRSNAKIQCGPDGNPANNCTFLGGNLHIINAYTVFYDQPENSVIEGVTFKGSLLTGALMVNGGRITFRNCIFEVRSRFVIIDFLLILLSLPTKRTTGTQWRWSGGILLFCAWFEPFSPKAHGFDGRT